MNYKDHYKHLTNESEVPFTSADTIQKGLRTKYGNDELDAYTFGIELEFKPDSSEFDITYDWDGIYNEMETNSEVLKNYDEHVESERKRLNKNWNGKIDDWDDTYGPVDPDTFDKYNTQPYSYEYDTDEEYNTVYDKWYDEANTVNRVYKRWKDYHYDDKLRDFITGLDPYDYLNDMKPYENTRFDADISIKNTMDYIHNTMKQSVVKGEGASQTNWAVGIDGDYIEIRSKHLNQNEFHLVNEICDYVENHNTTGKTSAHVHVGLPKDFDEFDLLAMTTLVDEKAIKTAVGPERALDSFARLRESLHAAILNSISSKTGEQIDKYYFISNKNIASSLKFIDRNHGTNISAMYKHRTIEFRYLDSTIASRSNVLINWIKYFLLLPKIAKTRNKITLKGLDDRNVIAVREAGGIRFYFDTKASTSNLPATDIKTSKPIVKGKYVPFVLPEVPDYTKYLRESVIRKVDIENLLPDKNNMEIAVDSLHKGMYSPNKQPIEVYPSEDKYIVADGHHRLLQSIIDGELSVNVKILNSEKPISRNGTIELDLYDGDYYGLDNKLDNGWLINRL